MVEKCLALVFLVLSVALWQPPLWYSRANGAVGSQAYASERSLENVALGRPYTLMPAGNYALCTDPGDAVQLTDGLKHTGTGFWAQKSTVGWQRHPQSQIIVDLGRVGPIMGVGFSTAAGAAGVAFPQAILVFVSDDGREYRYAGELIRLSAEHGLPAPQPYSTHFYQTERLQTKGRFVKLVVVAGSIYCFVDEVEVYRGPEEFVHKEAGEVITDLNQLIAKVSSENLLMNRLIQDCAEVTARITAASIPADEKDPLLQEMQQLRKEVAHSLDMPPGFRAILPVNSLHERIFQAHSSLLRKQGLPAVVLWQTHRWDPLGPFDLPATDKSQDVCLEMTMMQNEYRSHAFNVTNTTDQLLQLRIRVEGLPADGRGKCVSVQQVEHVDTRENVVVAAALPDAKRLGDSYVVTVPSGMTRQVWLTFASQYVTPGSYHGSVVVVSDDGTYSERLPVSLRVSSLYFPDQPDFHFGMFEYTEAPDRGVTAANREQVIASLKEHFITAPWARSRTVPFPTSLRYVNGTYDSIVDFSRFDQWVAEWPEAKMYCMFLSVGDSFVFINRSSKTFHDAVARWAKRWGEHIREKNLDPARFALLLVDEPRTSDQAARTTAWAKAIKAGEPAFTIWTDPVFPLPWDADPTFFAEVDVVCPNLSHFVSASPLVRDYYADLQDQGKALWFYQCSGPTRLLDPYAYYNLQPWYAWKYQAVGSAFWSFGDTGECFSWNEYLASAKTGYTPVYLDHGSVTTAKYWEAAREGIEDYQYLRMLKERIDQLKKSDRADDALKQAEKTLADVTDQVALDSFRTVAFGSFIQWRTPKDRSVADEARVAVLTALERLVPGDKWRYGWAAARPAST